MKARKNKRCLISYLLQAVIITIGIGFNSCSDDFLTKYPKGTAVMESLSPDELLIGAYAALSGAAATDNQNASAAASVRNWVWDCASDDAYKGTTLGDFSDGGEIERYEAFPSNALINSKWEVSYDGIARANDVLRSLALKQDEYNPEAALQIEAQAKFIRAWWHFRLQKVFWRIPYITEGLEDPSQVPNDRLVWDDIEADLNFAITHLPEAYSGQPGRVTKWAAMAYKAYVHLFQQEYLLAKPLLDEIINSGRFDLAEHFSMNYDVTHENNIESIFEIQSSVNDGSGARTRNGNADSWTTNPNNRFLPTCCGMYQPSQDLVNAFKVDEGGLPLLGINGPKYNEQNLEHDMGINSEQEFFPTQHPVDPRLDWTVGRRGIPYLDWGIFTGYDWIRSQVNGGPYETIKQMFSQEERAIASHSSFARATAINFRKLRFAHVLLWRAECAVEENDLETARNLVNRVRRRASDNFIMGRVTTYIFDGRPIEVDWSAPAANYLMGEYATFPSQEYGRAAVRMEIRLETALEGNRFFDLVRWGIDGEVLSKFIENDSEFRVFMRGAVYNSEKNNHWPIPQIQLDIQPGVLQQSPYH